MGGEDHGEQEGRDPGACRPQRGVACKAEAHRLGPLEAEGHGHAVATTSSMR